MTKIIKINKIQKVTKSRKCKKHKNMKMQKIKIIKNQQNQNHEKVIKKVSKNDPPWKRPKCHLNDQNRHFVKSEPPGPAFFEFQGVPRDPVLRPKLDPPYFCTFLMFCDCVFHFFHVLHFHVLWLLHILWFAIFGDMTHFWPFCNKA